MKLKYKGLDNGFINNGHIYDGTMSQVDGKYVVKVGNLNYRYRTLEDMNRDWKAVAEVTKHDKGSKRK